MYSGSSKHQSRNDGDRKGRRRPAQDLRKYMVGIKRKARAVKEVQEEFMEIDDIGSKKDPKERKKVISTLADIVSTILDVFY